MLTNAFAWKDGRLVIMPDIESGEITSILHLSDPVARIEAVGTIRYRDAYYRGIKVSTTPLKPGDRTTLTISGNATVHATEAMVDSVRRWYGGGEIAFRPVAKLTTAADRN